MPSFCHQIRFTTDGWTRSLHNAKDRFEAVHSPIEKLGGTIRATYFTTGPFDVLAISEFPEHISSSAIAVAFADGGAVASINTMPLLTASEAISAWGKRAAPACRTFYA